MHRALVDRLLGETAGRLLAQGSFEIAAAMTRTGSNAELMVLCEFRRLLALDQWEQAMRFGRAHLGRRVAGIELRIAAIEALQVPPGSANAIATLEKLITERDGDAVACGFYLVACAAQGRQPNLGLASVRAWSAALIWLMDDCPAELLDRVVRTILPVSGPNSMMAELGEVTSHAMQLPASRCFIDRRGRPVQFVPAENVPAQSLLVCLCGLEGRIGMPLNLFQRWLVPLPTHVLYLRDLADSGFARGVAELGEGFDAMVAFVRELQASLGATHLGVYGNSLGGFAAARLGAAAGAQRIVVAGGVALQRPSGAKGAPASAEELEAARQAASTEIGNLLQRSGHAPQIISVFSRGINRDVADAVALAGVGGVTLMPLERARHNVASELARSGVLRTLLAWAVGIGEASDVVAARPG